MFIFDLLVRSGLVNSKTQAKKLIQQKAISINKTKIICEKAFLCVDNDVIAIVDEFNDSKENCEFVTTGFNVKEPLLISLGKKKHFLLVVKS